MRVMTELCDTLHRSTPRIGQIMFGNDPVPVCCIIWSASAKSILFDLVASHDVPHDLRLVLECIHLREPFRVQRRTRNTYIIDLGPHPTTVGRITPPTPWRDGLPLAGPVTTSTDGTLAT